MTGLVKQISTIENTYGNDWTYSNVMGWLTYGLKEVFVQADKYKD